MPEGDTVYQAAAALHRALSGKTLTRCDIRVPRYATVDLTGETVDEVVARGKHLLIRIGSHTVHSHLKMEGRWDLYKKGARWRRPGFKARIILETSTVQAVGFELGTLEILRIRVTNVDRAGERTWVYGRAGRPCRRCGTSIESADFGAASDADRLIYWCPHCQPPP